MRNEHGLLHKTRQCHIESLLGQPDVILKTGFHFHQNAWSPLYYHLLYNIIILKSIYYYCYYCTDNSCSHVRAVEYFAESINTNNPFLAVKCISYIMYKLRFCKASDTSSLIVMGEHVDKK